MPFQAVPNGALCAVLGQLDGENVVNTLGFGLVTPATVTKTMLDVLTAGVSALWVASMLPTLPALYVYKGTIGRVLDVQDGPVSEAGIGNDTPGSLAGAILPNNCTFTVSFRTGLGGATNRGRNYVCGLLESEVVGSILGITRINALVGAYADFLGAGAVASGWTWSVISRKELVPGGPGRAVPINSVYIANNVVDSQRRRLPR